MVRTTKSAAGYSSSFGADEDDLPAAPKQGRRATRPQKSVDFSMDVDKSSSSNKSISFAPSSLGSPTVSDRGAGARCMLDVCSLSQCVCVFLQRHIRWRCWRKCLVYSFSAKWRAPSRGCARTCAPCIVGHRLQIHSYPSVPSARTVEESSSEQVSSSTSPSARVFSSTSARFVVIANQCTRTCSQTFNSKQARLKNTPAEGVSAAETNT